MKIRLVATALALLASTSVLAETVSAEAQQVWRCAAVFDAVATAEQEQRHHLLYQRFRALTQQARSAVLTEHPHLATVAPRELSALSEQARQQTLALFRSGNKTDVYSQALGCFRDLTQYSQDQAAEPQS